MRRFILLLIIWMLPLQPLFAADAQFAHLLDSQSTQEKTFQHMTEHIKHVAHHHDDDSDSHKDSSDQSMMHLASFDHGTNSSSLPTENALLVLNVHSDPEPSFQPVGYLSPPAAPPIKPPYLAL